MREDEFDIGYRLLDSDLIDSEDRRCGKVDDVRFDAGVGEAPHVEALLVGTKAMAQRLRSPLGELAARLARDETVVVPWEAVVDIDSVVHLRSAAAELGLGRGDDRMAKVVERLPGS